MDFLIANYMDILLVIFTAIGGLWSAAKLLAPLTETKVDDMVAGALGKVHGLLARILGLQVPEAPSDPAE